MEETCEPGRCRPVAVLGCNPRPHRIWRSASGAGAGLSNTDHHAGRALSSRRRRRRVGAHHGRQAVGGARTAGHRRQPCRRLRPRRHPRGRPRRARRVHPVPRPHRIALHQSEPLCQCRLRPAQGFFADRADRGDAGRAHRASVVSRQVGRRRDRTRQEGSRQAQPRQFGGRHRLLPVLGAVQSHGGRGHGDHSL